MRLTRLLLLVLLTCTAFANYRPWLPEELVHFIDHYLKEHPEAKVLEFGSGQSTAWFAQRCSSVYSVEHDPIWKDRVADWIRSDPSCHAIHYFLHRRPYFTVADQFPTEFFDLILVDGRNRKGCILHSLPKLKKGGILILDDADRPYYQVVFHHMTGWETEVFQQKIETSIQLVSAAPQGNVSRIWIKPM